ncbi:hypothetical protein ACFXAO_03200 [Streptomyces lavendulae]|uniref:hypothetical protein n=1 Tax=Streptomyces lavendulae TaxID=1914 RepID=UPI0036A26C53
MRKFKSGDRVSALYLSKKHGTCLAMNRYVIHAEDHPTYGQKVWVELPPENGRDNILSTHAHPDFINHMDADPVERQTPGTLIANLNWHLSMAAPDSTRPTWPTGWVGSRTEVPLSEDQRAAHASQAARHLQELRFWPREFASWKAAVTPEHLRDSL